MSNIYIERQTIQDSEGTELFFIDNYVSENEFACDISLTSVVGNSAPNETITDINSDSTTDLTDNIPSKKRYNRNNGGLSGGAIAAIVISLVVVIGVVVTLIALGKKGILFGSQAVNEGRSFEPSLAKMNVSTNWVRIKYILEFVY